MVQCSDRPMVWINRTYIHGGRDVFHISLDIARIAGVFESMEAVDWALSWPLLLGEG